MQGAYETVMESRKQLVDEILKNLEKGYIFSEAEWDGRLLRPHNPLSGAWYRGGNRLKLMRAVVCNSYTDLRWMTFKQIEKNGLHLKKGSKGVLCEKWIFEKEVKRENARGEWELVTEELTYPMVNYFYVFNGQQVEGLPELIVNPKLQEEDELLSLANDFLKASERPVKELGQDRAYYSPLYDEIVLPLRTSFKNAESFLGTLIHEQGHSTGHKDRLSRDLTGGFGSKSYAREELIVELASIFVEADLGLATKPEHFNDHTNYLGSWIKALKDDPNELFRATAAAEEISERLLKNLSRVREVEVEAPRMETVQPEKRNTQKKNRGGR